MTPQLARFALCGFACLASAVAINALYLQSRSTQPARPSSERASLERKPPAPARTAHEERRPVPMQANAAKLENPPEPGATDGRPDTIRAIQRELTARGYGPVTVDGIPGLATRAAIMAFEADEGLALTAIANEQMLKNILLGAVPGSRPPGDEPPARAQEVIRAVQNWLLSLGFAAGPATGAMTAETEKAIRAFETSVGITPRGRISADLVRRLADAAPLKSAIR